MNKTVIFTDGSSRGNPGPGGWGSVIVYGPDDAQKVIELGGGENNTTNNRMELKAAIEGLKQAKLARADGSLITVFTDSSYLINGITKWIHGWKRNGWQTKTKDDVLNKDLWMELAETAGDLDIKWEYVGGHVGILGNERCDHIATAFADNRDVKLHKGPISEYDLPDILNISRDELRATTKKSSSSRSRAQAYSYISSVGGAIKVHQTWAECEERVKGVKGARFKKALNADEEAQIIKEFGTM